MKLSQEISKVLIPCKKKAYRLVGKDGRPILDVLLADHEPDPQPGQRIMCRHPFVSRKRAIVTPTVVERLECLVYDHGRVVPGANRTLQEARANVQHELASIRPDILQYTNPTPYKVSVSETLYDFFYNLWQAEIPLAELR
jgi:nicotinate phosphoribosyltransferase